MVEGGEPANVCEGRGVKGRCPPLHRRGAGDTQDLSPMETETLRRMSADRKLAVMTSLIREAYRLKGAWFGLFVAPLEAHG